MSPDLRVRPLTPDTYDALAALFDEGGDPRRCSCLWWRQPNAEWQRATAQSRRAELRDLAGNTPAAGLVAFDGERAAGWVSVAPRPDYRRLRSGRSIPTLPGDDVWSIVCFVVGRDWRGQGVTRLLLDAAVEHATRCGAQVVEAYPVDTGGGRIPAASAYVGTLATFTDAGFTVAADRAGTSGGRSKVVVRRVVGAT